MKRKTFLIVLCLGLVIMGFAQSSEDDAMSLYFSGKNAYNSGDYETAQDLFQRALVMNPDIEARAQNIKFMLGVSAFNNRDYKTARAYLVLFPNSPIAKELLSKIEQIESGLSEDHYYYEDSFKEQVKTPTTRTATESTSTVAGENETGGLKTSFLVIISVLIVAIVVILEIKLAFFSKLSLKLVGVSPETVTFNLKQKATETEEAPEPSEAIESEETKIPEKAASELLDTPFDEEIDIDEMASKEIDEIARFFEEEKTGSEETNSSRDSEEQSRPEEAADKSEEEAREAILQSLNDEEETEEEQKQTEESAEDTEASGKPDYEHLDNLPEDFDVNGAIKKAMDIVEKTKSEVEQADEGEDWKTVDEMTEELEEKEKYSIDYFQELDDMNDDNLEKYYDFVFEKHMSKDEE